MINYTLFLIQVHKHCSWGFHYFEFVPFLLNWPQSYLELPLLQQFYSLSFSKSYKNIKVHSSRYFFAQNYPVLK